MGTAAELTPAALTPDALLRRLEWRVLRPLDGRLQGEHRSAFRGTGTDFKDLRAYEPGDDVRHIDWNVTARLDEPFVREFLEDREITAWLLIDRSASMAFGPAERSKALVLTEVAVGLSRLFGRGGNRVGALLFDDAVRHTIEPAGGRHQTLRLARALLEPDGGRGTATDLPLALQTAQRMIRRRSVVIVLSDFISPTTWERPLGELRRRHDVVAVRVTDRREFALPAAGLLVFEDAETGEQLTVDTDDPALHRRLAAVVAEREAELTAAARRSGVELVGVSTDDDLLAALVRIVSSRRLQGQRR